MNSLREEQKKLYDQWDKIEKSFSEYFALGFSLEKKIKVSTNRLCMYSSAFQVFRKDCKEDNSMN